MTVIDKERETYKDPDTIRMQSIAARVSDEEHIKIRAGRAILQGGYNRA